MNNDHKTFRFKGFSVTSGGQTFGVGTDAVLLGSWVDIPESGANILDIGTGSGVIALMLASRDKAASVTGVDISAHAVSMARANAGAAEFAGRTRFIHSDIRDPHIAGKFDLVVSNPPYFPKGAGVSASHRSVARSFETLTPTQLIHSAARLTRQGGSLAVVIPEDIAAEFEFTAWENGFHVYRSTRVVTVEGKKAKRRLLQFVKDTRPEKENHDTITLCNPDGTRTGEYSALTEHFYLDKPRP